VGRRQQKKKKKLFPQKGMARKRGDKKDREIKGGKQWGGETRNMGGKENSFGRGDAKEGRVPDGALVVTNFQGERNSRGGGIRKGERLGLNSWGPKKKKDGTGGALRPLAAIKKGGGEKNQELPRTPKGVLPLGQTNAVDEA